MVNHKVVSLLESKADEDSVRIEKIIKLNMESDERTADSDSAMANISSNPLINDSIKYMIITMDYFAKNHPNLWTKMALKFFDTLPTDNLNFQLLFIMLIYKLNHKTDTGNFKGWDKLIENAKLEICTHFLAKSRHENNDFTNEKKIFITKVVFNAVGEEGSLDLITALAKKSLSDTTRLINELSDFFVEEQLHEVPLYRALGKGIQERQQNPSVIFTALTPAQIVESGSQIFQAIFEGAGAEIQEIILDSLRSIRKVFTSAEAPFVDNTKIISMAESTAAAVYALFLEKWNIAYDSLILSSVGNGSDNNKMEATAAAKAALEFIKPFIPDMTEKSKGEFRARMTDDFTFKNYLDLFDEAVFFIESSRLTNELEDDSWFGG